MEKRQNTRVQQSGNGTERNDGGEARGSRDETRRTPRHRDGRGSSEVPRLQGAAGCPGVRRPVSGTSYSWARTSDKGGPCSTLQRPTRTLREPDGAAPRRKPPCHSRRTPRRPALAAGLPGESAGGRRRRRDARSGRLRRGSGPCRRGVSSCPGEATPVRSEAGGRFAGAPRTRRTTEGSPGQEDGRARGQPGRVAAASRIAPTPPILSAS